ncbi:MAG TPA: hypothetical protein VFI06_07900 [Chitinophagaceae bacterium]|nr:hypothetical protein [Chitinophagaceae bacterium]
MRPFFRHIAIFSFVAGSISAAHGQDYERMIDSLHNAFYNAEETRQFEKAIGYVQKIISISRVEETTPFFYWEIAGLYDSLGDREQSKAYYRLAVMTGQVDNSYRKRRYAIRLADEFIAGNNYDSALYYLQYVQRIPSQRNLCGSNGIYYRTEFNYRLMLAYEGSNQIDSAINCFLPYAFQSWTNNEGTECSILHIMQKDYHCQVMDFLRVLRKKYNPTEITQQLNELIDHAYVRTRRDPDYNGWCQLNCDFGVRFFNRDIDLSSFGTGCQANPEEDREWADAARDDFIHDLQQSLIYLLGSSPNYL